MLLGESPQRTEHAKSRSAHKSSHSVKRSEATCQPKAMCSRIEPPMCPEHDAAVPDALCHHFRPRYRPSGKRVNYDGYLYMVPFLRALFTEVRRRGILSSSYPESCIVPALTGHGHRIA